MIGRYHKIIFLILISLIYFFSSELVIYSEENILDGINRYAWLSEAENKINYGNSFLITDQILCIENCEELKGWNIKPYNSGKARNAKNDAMEYFLTYPSEIIHKFIDNIYMIDELEIRGNRYAGTIVDKTMYTAIDITEYSTQIWLKMVLSHEFFHIREEYYQNTPNKYNPYYQLDRLIDEKNLVFFYDEGFDYGEWLDIDNKRYSEKKLLMGYVREYSMFSRREFKANIAQAVDMGAYRMLSKKSETIKEFMDIYINGNIAMFKSLGYKVDESYYKEFLPKYIENNYNDNYKKLLTLYNFKNRSVLKKIVDSGLEIFLSIPFIIILIFKIKKYLRIPLDEEELKRKRTWGTLFKL